jgi:hypothetical protein
MALVLPGGLIALGIAWVSQRPQVKARLVDCWNRIRGRAQSAVAMQTMVLVAIPVPVSRNRCNDTQVFATVRDAA